MRFNRTVWFSLRSSLWFVPTIIVALGAGGAVALIAIDAQWHQPIGRVLPPMLTADPDGARQVLAAIATSMITVAGVSFSVTIVSLSLASSQYGPRVLRNFMRDPLNQGVLGILLSVFTYCILVLQAIRSAEEPFVPQLALWGGVFFALVGIAGLVTFIHHTAVSIQASEIIAKIADETVRALKATGADPSEKVPDPAASSDPGEPEEIAADRSGYIQDVEVRQLIRLARERDVVLQVQRSVGDFVVEGRPLIAARPQGRLARDDHDFLRQQFGLSSYRTIEQDPEFGVRQLVDIALKALSPSINDSTTAVNCIDYLEHILQAALTLPAASEYRGSDGKLRVVVKEPGQIDLLRVSLNEIRQNSSDNVAVTLRLIKLIHELHGLTDDQALREALQYQAKLIREAASSAIRLREDREEVYRRIQHLLPTR
jgi:uncharacterized membrane protein